MNSSADTPRNQEDGSSSGRRKFMKMLSLAAGAGVATAVSGTPAAAAVASGASHPFGQCESRTDMKIEYDRQMLAHLCLMSELMREWYNVNKDGIRLTCPELEGDLYDFMFETRASALAVARTAGIELDQGYVAARAAEYKVRAMGGAA